MIARKAARKGWALALGAACALTAGCARRAEEADRPDRDPLTAAAIEAPLMTDPDLAQANARNQAIAPAGPADGSLPEPDFSERERDAARGEALDLGGSRGDSPVQAGDAVALLGAARGVTLVDRLAATLHPGACVSRIEHGFRWSAALPGDWPIYPRGHTLEAAGRREAFCALNAVRFVTGASADEVLAFYHARAVSADYADAVARGSRTVVLTATRHRDNARFAMIAQPWGDGLTAVDLLLSGG